MESGMIMELKPHIVILDFSLPLPKMSYSITSDANIPPQTRTRMQAVAWTTSSESYLQGRYSSLVTTLWPYDHTVDKRSWVPYSLKNGEKQHRTEPRCSTVCEVPQMPILATSIATTWGRRVLLLGTCSVTWKSGTLKKHSLGRLYVGTWKKIPYF